MPEFTDLLRHNRNYRYTWLGQVVSETGDYFNNIAVFSLVMAVTGSGLVVSGPGGTLDPYAHPPHRRLGRHLPRHDVLHHGARCPRLCAGPPGSRGSHPPLRIPLD